MSSDLPELVSIEYPGIVQNLDNMMDTIGGTDKLRKTFEDPASRLEVFPRPNDIHSHPLMGDRVSSNNLLVKCIRRKVTTDEGEVKYVYEAQVMGLISVSYKFESLADFQYLPMERVQDEGSNAGYRSIYNDILPEKPLNSMQIFNKDAPLFLLPTIFSRFDSPIDYYYRDPPVRSDKSNSNIVDPNVIGGSRKPRSILPMCVNWSDEIPTEPHASIFETIKSSLNQQSIMDELKKCFQQKPIWSKNALLHKLKCCSADLKQLLPCVAYYYPNGPFRCQWVRYGFDPKKNKSCKIYQTLDFRVKSAFVKGECSNKITAKRSVFELNPIRKRESLKKTHDKQGSFIDSSLLSARTTSVKDMEKSNTLDEERAIATFVFTPGVLPTYRQVHYQLCDIKVDAVQKLIHSNDDNEPEECHDKDGWCGEGVIDQIRYILSVLTDDMLKKSEQSQESTFYDDADSSEHELSNDEYLSYLTDEIS
ncbi:general transcription factor IIIC subunit l(2)37Cd [Brevipalpus obovatus]|uniref:general transcription factor IIIC subunit l(2)37Cd n=1 Tax=Brevipalpus obovatus TaxID=246614 RepID=UPI003D9DE501